MLDLGCGTGFMINIGRSIFAHIDGVDVTQAMLDKVDRSGPALVELHRADSAGFPVEAGGYDVVTSYSFLHHLYDCVPTIHNAWRALKPGGAYYVDLEPNFDFWEAIGKLDRHGDYHPIVKREIEMVAYKDEDIQKQFGVSMDVFNKAEWGKSMRGGFSGAFFDETLRSAGFSRVDLFYEWFVGQGQMINDESLPREQRFANAEVVHGLLASALPLSRALFKYIGFVAIK
jgi:SAM-dependent methyltransferase